MNGRVIVHRQGDKRKDHKYVARVPLSKGGDKLKYRYFYTSDEYKAYLNSKKTSEEVTEKDSKSSVDKFFDSVSNKIDETKARNKAKVKDFFKDIGMTLEKEVEELPDKINTVVDTVKKVANDLYEDADNIYDIHSGSYDEKIKKISETPEWKAIVARKDPEYVKTEADGTTSYLIDDYLAKKKQPLIDVVDDIVSNRPVTINKLDGDAIVSGVKDKIYGIATIGVVAAKAVTTALIEKSKVTTGAYDEEIAAMKTKVNNGVDYVNKTLSTTDSVSSDDIQQTMQLIQSSKKAVESEVEKRNINEEDVLAAARILMNSESGDFKEAEKLLSDLSEEEMIMLNILMNGAMNG